MGQLRSRRQSQRTLLGPDGRERRRSCRYPATLRSALLRWEQDGSMVEEPVVLEDISQHGCRVKTRSGPPRELGFFLRFLSPAIDADDGIESLLVGFSRTFFGVKTLRIRFLEPLPFASFKILVYGPDQRESAQAGGPEHEWDCYWR